VDPFVYVYAVGGVVFVVGLLYAARMGWVGLSGPGLRNLLVCVGVAGFFALLQGWQQYAPMEVLPARPYDGGAEHVLGSGDRVRGTWLDYAIVVGYFVAILVVGMWFGRKQTTTKDFFFGGSRFSWWLIAFSLIATTVGSYSFVKYSSKGFEYGLSSSQSYLNDWIWLPLLLFGWLPILYYSRITSIPEYFGRRFGPGVRLAATICILVYLVGYVGVNLFTMGKVVNALLGVPILLSALIVAVVSASYVTSGGQTSVIMTDLLQGVMLLATGLLIIYLGASHMGGGSELWGHLDRGHRLAFTNFNEDAGFPTVGIFWQDSIANSAMFYFLNQGIMMRFMAARSLREASKAAVATVLVLMTIGAAVVGGGGWVAAALVHAGYLPNDLAPSDAFYVATELLSAPGVFGLVLAALTAALMSTVDTLITAVAAIAVNDLYKPYVKPDAGEKEMLRIARVSSVAVTILGVALVPVFMQFDSIYAAHGAFTAAVTPPLAVTLLLSVFWRRFTRPAAYASLLGGLGLVVVSLFVPEIITPLAHGVPIGDPGDGFLGGMRQHTYMRAIFGVAVSVSLGVVVALFTKPESEERQLGLVWGTVTQALSDFRRSVRFASEQRALGAPVRVDEEAFSADDRALPLVNLSRDLAAHIQADVGDRVYVTDRRSWLGGLNAVQAKIGVILDDEGRVVMGPVAYESVVKKGREAEPVRIERS
jgi:SSS family solute:Na+ symporter